MRSFLCVALCYICLQGTLADSTVKVAVLEAQITGRSIEENLKNYMNLYDRDGQQAKIVVLPEYSLTGIVRDNLDQYAIKINESIAEKTNVSLINNWAKTNKVYVAAHFIEKDGDDFYSTTIVVNGSDKILAKYRKINLNDTESNLKAGVDTTTFNTDFGVIGLISGEDILHENPSQKIFTDNNKTTIIIYTTAFNNTAPFKTAPSLHQGYAQANGIHLLVANLNDPKKGMSGSGIYSKNKIFNTYISATPGSKFTVGTLDLTDKINGFRFSSVYGTGGTDKEITELTLKYDYGDVRSEVFSKNLNNNKTCDGDFCCNFTVTAVAFNKDEHYRWAVKGGSQKICVILHCTTVNEDLETCGKPQVGALKTTFTKIEIKTEKSDTKFRPYTSHAGLHPEIFNFQQSDTGIVMKIDKTTTNILVMGIITASGASSISLIMGVNFIAFVLALKYLL